jgi:hypothetical protein
VNSENANLLREMLSEPGDRLSAIIKETEMSQQCIVRAGRQLFVYSFTTGVKPVKLPGLKTERDTLSYVLWLEHNGYIEEAERLFEVLVSTENKR